MLLVGVEVVDECADAGVHLSILVHEIADFFVTVHHGGVVFVAKHCADLFPRVSEDFPGDVDGHVAGGGDVGFSGNTEDFIGFDPVMLADAADDLVEARFGDDKIGVVSFHDFGGEGGVDGLSGEACLSGEFVEGSFEVANGSIDPFGDGHGGFLVDSDAFNVGPFEEDGAFGFGVGVLDIHDESGLEPRAESLVHEEEIAGGSVGAENDLFSEGFEVVEGVEDFFEGFVLSGDVLDVIEEPDIDASLLPAEPLNLVVFEGGDKFLHKLRGGDVHDAVVRVTGENFICDGVKEVGFSESGGPVDEEGVEPGSGVIGDGFGASEGEAVGLTLDEVVEGQSLHRFEPGGFGGAGGCGGDGVIALAWSLAGREFELESDGSVEVSGELGLEPLHVPLFHPIVNESPGGGQHGAIFTEFDRF